MHNYVNTYYYLPRLTPAAPGAGQGATKSDLLIEKSD